MTRVVVCGDPALLDDALILGILRRLRAEHGPLRIVYDEGPVTPLLKTEQADLLVCLGHRARTWAAVATGMGIPSLFIEPGDRLEEVCSRL